MRPARAVIKNNSNYFLLGILIYIFFDNAATMLLHCAEANTGFALNS